MVNRRRALRRLILAPVSLGLTGCVGERTKPWRHSAGETITHGDLEMAVARVRTTNKLITGGSDKGEEEVVTPAQGAVFALAYLQVRNVSDSEATVPERRSHVNLIYSESESEDELVTGPLGSTDDGRGRVYSDSVDEIVTGAGAAPGAVVRGWVVFELPRGFERSEAFVTIRYPTASSEIQRFYWRFGD